MTKIKIILLFITLYSSAIYSAEIYHTSNSAINFKFIHVKPYSLNSDAKDIIGFGFYTGTAATFTVSGIPLLVIGLYNYSLGKTNYETVPFIVTGVVSLSAGLAMFTGLIIVTIIVYGLFNGLRIADNKYIKIIFG